jgi:murein DD-endopeptidase MepM/ murein hydrolase activator NlpD
LGTKKITIVFLSEGARKVRQFKFPKFLLSLFFLGVFLGGGLISFVIHDYASIKKEVPELAELRRENSQQRVQLLALSQKIQNISNEMKDLREFDHKLKVMVNLDAGEEEGQFLGMGGSEPSDFSQDYSVERAHIKLVRLYHQTLDNLEQEVSVRKQEKSQLYKYLEDQKAMLSCTPSIWPTKGWVSSGFGTRTSPFTNQKEFHQGIDICNRKGTPILAPADGIVATVGKNHGYGKILTIKHGYGLKTRFAHLNKILVKKGEYVKRGQEIAEVGNTGRTTGPHLHYEVHLKDMPVDPRLYILN